MDFDHATKTNFLNKFTYINLRWIGIIGQFITINSVKFIFNFDFNYILANVVILIGIFSNLYLVYFYKKNQLSNNSALSFLILDILQLSFLLYLSGGILNPFSIFLLIPSVFSSLSINLKTNIILIIFTILSIIFLTFYYQDLPSPLNEFKINIYYFYAIPLSLIIALIFLNYFALTFGKESHARKEALDKIQEVISKEHELVSLGGQAAAAAHSLGTPLSTIKLITHELSKQFQNNKEVEKDIELLTSQVERCNDILKKLTLNPTIEDDFIYRDLAINDYVLEIVNSFKEISKKKI